MIEAIILITAIVGLAFLLKESDGPWGIISWFRNKLFANKHVGVFFFQMFDCYFCLGFHCGWIVYLLSAASLTWQFFILWGLAGGTISLIFSKLLER